MKKIYMAFIAFAVFVLYSMSMTSAKEKDIIHTTMLEVNIDGANIKLKKGKSDTIETKYYGTASDQNYNLETTIDGNKYKITLNYTGSGMAPTIKEGGVIVKIPDGYQRLCINGKSGSGIVLNGINVDSDFITKSCAVIINSKNSNHKIRIDSNHDVYKITSVPLKKDFALKSTGSVVKYTFTEQPLNLKLELTGGYAELPTGWSRDFSVGLRQPKMTVNVEKGIFELFIDN